MEILFTKLADQPVLFLFLLIGVGMAFGHIKIKGIGLGAAAVLFLAIILSAWAETYGIHLRVTRELGTLGLALFAFAIGMNSGASFFHNIKSAVGPILAMVALYGVSAAAGEVIGRMWGMDPALIAGTFAGSVTNTPALAAAGEASGKLDLATVGYSIAYLFGVVGMLIASAAALSYGKRDKDAPSPLANRTIRVERGDHPCIGDIHTMMGSKVTFSRLRRGDVDMIAEPGLILQQGDRVRVVAPTSKMREITKFFGDSARGLSDLNPIALGVGMALGILIGEIPIFTPTGAYFSIGSAAGTLIVGLIFGRLGRIGPFVTAMPFTAGQVLAEFGLLVFLAQAGANAGGQIEKAFTSGTWLQILLLGIIMTSIMAVGLYVVMRWIFKMGGTKLSGLLAGAQTQPAVLAFANSRTNMDPRVSLGYALVYPVAMIGKILVAQIMGGM